MKSMIGSRKISVLFVLFIVMSLATPILTPATATPELKTFASQPFTPPTTYLIPELSPEPRTSHAKIDSVLVQLASAAQESKQAAASLASSRNLSTRHGNVQVQITAADGQILAASHAIQSLGGEISGRSKDGKLLQAWLPPQSLLRLASQESVTYIRLPAQAITAEEPQAIEVTSEATLLINAPAWQAAGLSGGGVKVAIIDAGFSGYPGLLGSELPASVTVKNFVDGENELDVTGTTNHGTAVAEVVYDIAPQASLYLVKVNTPIDLEEAVGWLITQDVDIINTSVGWFNVSPGDGTGFFTTLAQEARDNSIFWVTAAGNSRTRHWGGTFNDMNGDGYHDYEFLGGSYYLVNYFSPGPGEGYIISAGTLISGYLRWDDWTEVTQDYNLYLVRYVSEKPPNPPYWTTVAASAQVQSGLEDQTPTEYVEAIAPTTTYYGFIISRFNSTRNVNLELFAARPSLHIYYQLHSRSLYNLADVSNVFTTSAMDIVAPYLQELYSSEGPTNGPGGTADGGLIKPDIAGFAKVTTATYGVGVFNGTAAAAAHVAGAAALVKSAAPSYTPDQIGWYLQSQAIDMGATGKDTLYGSGRLYLGNPLLFQTPPNISGLPDQLLAQGSSLSQAVDLWAYTSDPYTPDEQLVFSIDNSPNPGAGISITDNRYLTIQPLPTWTGQTPVSVRVTTPYNQVDSDQLEVTVLAPPDISNLPDQVLPMNGSLNPAIDLWAYSTDAYYSDEQLTFSLDPAIRPDAGISLRENRYIDINPLMDWTGDLQVNISVLSPIGLTDADDFNLVVLAPPDINTLPDQFVPTNVSRYQVIDLWAYTEDAYIPVEDMSFTIDNTPAPEAGVSISQNRFIDIQPATDWTGQTQVTVRATTPYLQSDVESFNVTVGRYKIWNGSLNQVWEEGLNWTPEGMPVIEDSVIIPDTANHPLLSYAAAIYHLMIEPGAVLDLETYPLSVEDEVINRGSLKQTLWVNPGETTQFLHLTNQSGEQDLYWGVALLPAAEEPADGVVQEGTAVTVTVAGEQYCPLRFSGVKRCYEIQASQPLNADLTFYFSQTEANSLDPETLVTYRLDLGWIEESGGFTGGSNSLGYYLTAPERALPGVFSLDLSGNPTYVLMMPLVMNNNLPLSSQNPLSLEMAVLTESHQPADFRQIVMQSWLSIKKAFLR